MEPAQPMGADAENSDGVAEAETEKSDAEKSEDVAEKSDGVANPTSVDIELSEVPNNERARGGTHCELEAFTNRGAELKMVLRKTSQKGMLLCKKRTQLRISKSRSPMSTFLDKKMRQKKKRKRQKSWMQRGMARTERFEQKLKKLKSPRTAPEALLALAIADIVAVS